MGYTKDDNKKAGTYLQDKGYDKQKNGTGFQNGDTVVKQQGNSWVTNKGDKFTDLSDLKNSKKI